MLSMSTSATIRTNKPNKVNENQRNFEYQRIFNAELTK